ncbi:hypothetical protein ACHAW6_015025, partial [Cyclotella cf. meneghiniana]
IPKKDGHICWISYLCQLNKIIKYKLYPLPIILDFYKSIQGQVYHKLDISIQYYTFELDEESQDLCTIIMFCKDKCGRLQMGLTCSPIIAQAILEVFWQASKM